jgi:Na+-translocating ferredoxin:NAD+ oxidoreductase RnfC subunit
MDVFADKVIKGLRLAVDATGAKKGIVALKEKYHKATDSINAAISKSGDSRLSIFHLGNFYPAGDEFVLVYEVTGRIIPEGGLPLQVGIVVDNVVTLLNVANAADGLPVTDRPLTVCGAVRNPLTAFFPIGTQVSEVITAAGGASISDYVILDGGPMMGKIVSASDVITKRTSGILVLPSDSEVVYQKSNRHAVKQVRSACEQCQDCTEICPRFLLGHKFECHKIQRSTAAGIADNITMAFMCCECGLCDWVCPVKLLPRRVNQENKKKLMREGVKSPHHDAPTDVHPMRDYRRVPIDRVLGRLDLFEYDKPAPLTDKIYEITKVKIPLSQHIGVPAVPVVKAGDSVKKGDLIAEVPEGKLGARIHASIGGIIKTINDCVSIER